MEIKEVISVHAIVAIDCPPPQHEVLVRSMNERKYPTEGKRKGFNQVHVSEIRLYNLRAKKEVMPIALNDLGAWCVTDKDMIFQVLNGIDKWNENGKKKKSLKKRLLSRFVVWSCLKVLKVLKLVPPKLSEGKRDPFVQGWHYVYAFANIEDVDRGHGEEL